MSKLTSSFMGGFAEFFLILLVGSGATMLLNLTGMWIVLVVSLLSLPMHVLIRYTLDK